MREQRFAALRRGLAAIAAITALAAFAGVAAAAPASAATATPEVVLVNAPTQQVAVGHTFQVGVWYQQISGGRTSYTINVYNPAGVRIFYHAGWASPSYWQLWNIRAGRTGYYRTVYHAWYHYVWTKTVFQTHSI